MRQSLATGRRSNGPAPARIRKPMLQGLARPLLAPPVMTSSRPSTPRTAQGLRAARRQRGATTVEYLVLLVLVVLPSVSLAVVCFERVTSWYARFVSTVAQADP